MRRCWRRRISSRWAIEPAPRASRARAVANRRGEFLRPVVVEQGQEAPRVRAQCLAACCEAVEEGGGGRTRHAEPVPGGVDVGLVRGGEQALELRGVFDGLPRVVAAADGGPAPVWPSRTRTVVALATSVRGRRTGVWGIEY